MGFRVMAMRMHMVMRMGWGWLRRRYRGLFRASMAAQLVVWAPMVGLLVGFRVSLRWGLIR